MRIGRKDNRKHSLCRELEELSWSQRPKPWNRHVCVCVCMRKAAYSNAFEYLYLSMSLSICGCMCASTCASIFLQLCMCVCVCWVYLSKSKVLACKIYRVRCQAKTSFAAPLTFVFVTSFVSIFTTQPKNCRSLRSCLRHAPTTSSSAPIAATPALSKG